MISVEVSRPQEIGEVEMQIEMVTFIEVLENG
jgi:hypothetical protein